MHLYHQRGTMVVYLRCHCDIPLCGQLQTPRSSYDRGDGMSYFSYSSTGAHQGQPASRAFSVHGYKCLASQGQVLIYLEYHRA